MWKVLAAQKSARPRRPSSPIQWSPELSLQSKDSSLPRASGGASDKRSVVTVAPDALFGGVSVVWSGVQQRG